ncbi:hypothetical protein AXG93_829s1110 [Marchantia polymorpha subsp. ruderalis]|uniref:Mitochondrial carrier protein n=1 Tax=Marchantia polymorpha subsp. ruderalis TaxID=1480154 RepID=A0A176W217_MARPO|nr:hypothetical protein AXG93_829s1110 [Marchantia polymorpha subsp. ruderalis]
MGQKKLRFRSDNERSFSAADTSWNTEDSGGRIPFFERVYNLTNKDKVYTLMEEEDMTGIEAHRRPIVTRGSFQNVKLSFVSLPLTGIKEEKLAPTQFPWRWSWKMWLPGFEDAEPGEAETALNHVYAGAMARTVSQVGIHPVDTVKTRMQVKDPAKQLRKWKKKVASKPIGLGPVGIDNWFVKGPGDLFRGVTGAILGTVPTALLYFASYEVTKRKLKKILPENWDGLIHVASASVGTIVASIVRVPADTVKHRVQAYMHANDQRHWPSHNALQPYTISLDIFSSTPEHLLLGAFAGAIAATCTMPLDFIKTRQQCGMSASIPDIVASVIQEKGVGGLFTGLGSRVLHVSLMSALFFGLFEYCKLVMTHPISEQTYSMYSVLKPGRDQYDSQIFPKIMLKRRDKIWKRQFVYTG